MRRFLKRLWRILTFPLRAVWWLVSLPLRGIRRLVAFLREEPADRPMAEAIADVVESPRSLFDNIEALRKHLLRALLGLAVAILISFIFTQQVLEFLARPIGGLQMLQAIEVTEMVGVFMRVALLCGFTLALPYISFEIWLFAAPGLKPRAKVIGLSAIPLVLIFFVVGAAFAYLQLLPPALKFLLNFMGVNVMPRPASYITFVTGVLFWIGVSFEYPLVVYVLTSMGLVKPRLLVDNWRIAIVVVALISAAITPTTDPVNMALVMGPMIALYFVGILLSYVASIGHKKQLQAKMEQDAAGE